MTDWDHTQKDRTCKWPYPGKGQPLPPRGSMEQGEEYRTEVQKTRTLQILLQCDLGGLLAIPNSKAETVRALGLLPTKV